MTNDIDTEKNLDRAIADAVAAVKAWDGRKAWSIETDWLDTECFVINFKASANGGCGEFGSRRSAEGYAEPLLVALGEIAERILNDERTDKERSIGHWNAYSELNYWDADGEDFQSYEDWETIQVEVRFDLD